MGHTLVLQEINELFAWNPPPLHLAPMPPGKKLSIRTHPPAFYDKHIPSSKALLHVKWLSSLVHKLAVNVDKAFTAALETLLSLKGFITAEDCDRDMDGADPYVKNEEGVAKCYLQTTTRFCKALSSTLTLHPKASSYHFTPLLRLCNYGWTALFHAHPRE